MGEEHSENSERNRNIAENLFQNGGCLCDWNKGTKKMLDNAIDTEKFWRKYVQVNDDQTLKHECDPPARALYNMKTVHIFDLALHMGLAPKYGFKFVCCLEQLDDEEQGCIFMNLEQLNMLYFAMRDISFEIKHICSDTSRDWDKNLLLETMIEDKTIQAQYREMSSALTFFVDVRSVLLLIQHWPFIKKSMELIMSERAECKDVFVRALYIYAEDEINLSIFHAPNVRQFLLHILNLKCNCLKKKCLFTEIAFKWLEWFYICASTIKRMISADELKK